MGQGFSLTTLSAGSAGIDVPELADLVYEKSMGTARFMKSIRARHQDGVVLVKVIVKPYPMRLEKYKRKIIQERKALADVPNALAYQRIIETETSGFLVRQYLYSSLYDRMSTRPFLEDIEKKWLAFQLLCGIRDCHAREIFHGDIKTENTLVTSWNWLYLSDFSSSFKPTTLPEDNPADFSYFFDTAGRRTCYLAPERFLAAGETPDPKAQITWAMDVFSAGCVIAELFLEAPIFNLSQLYKYRRGEYDPVATHLSRIVDSDVREMVAHMIQVDPESRYSAEEYLDFWRKKVFPDYFYSFLHQYMGLITDPSSGRTPISGASANLGEADERIDRIYYDFDKISYFLGYENEKRVIAKSTSTASGLELFPVHLNIPNNEHQASTIGRRPTDDGTLIFLALVVSSIRNTARATAKIRACDVLLAFSERLTDEAKLDRVLPYLVALLNDKADIVKVAAIRTLTQLMALVTVVSPVNAHVFPEYILPRMQAFLPGAPSEPASFVRATYAACLGSLATSASRFLDMVATLRADGSLPTADPETEDGGGADAAFQGLFDNSRAELIETFASHTKALITDGDSSVRRAFLGSVPELCMFFGTADSNDIILSHLNTYLNDRNWMLKCAFFETIVGVATFLGGTSLEEFILPLMVQALTDPEDFVVKSVLYSLASMAQLGLFQRAKTWELVDVVGRFTMHPNIWIREAAAMFLSSATLFLSIADNQCIVLPLIRPYLKMPIKDFSEVALLDNLKKPLSRAILDLSVTWATKVDRGIFWKPVHQLRTFSFDSNNLIIPTISGKDLGHHALQKVPKNEEDEQWLSKLRNMGLTAEDDFKLLCLREYIWRLALSKAREATPHPSYLNNVVNLRSIGITPQTVMFDDQQIMDEPLRRINSGSDGSDKVPHTIADALLDASMSIDDSIARRRRSAFNNHKTRLTTEGGTLASASNERDGKSPVSPSPALSPSPKDIESPGTDPEPRRRSSAQLNGRGRGSDDEGADTGSSVNSREVHHGIHHKISAMNLMSRKDTAKSFPETGTTSTNAFGKVEGPFTQNTGKPSALSLAKEQNTAAEDRIRFRGAHTYTGNDPSILKMLDAMYIDNYPNDIAEFGPMIAPSSRRKTINKSTSQAPDRPWKPEGILVATFAEHTGPVHHIAIAPDHLFFLTGGDDGCVKVWDTGRLERNITHRSRATHKQGSDPRITALCFVEHTHSFISCASDGSINVVRVECSHSSGAVRYGKLRMLREYQLPKGEMAVWSDHFKIETSSTLLVATNRSKIHAIDLRTMDVLYTLDNPVHHGTPTCFVVDRKRHWLLLGTSHGVLDLWDLRFRVRLKAWGVPGATTIYRMCLHPTKGRGRWVCVAGGSGQGEVTIWDIEKTQCREVYRTGGNRDGPKGYDPWPVDEDRPEGMLGRFATALEPSGSSNSDRGIRAMIAGTDNHDDSRESKYGFIITGGSDKKIRFWDVTRVENSMVVSGLDTEEPKPTFTTAHPTASLTLNTERIPRPNPTAPNAGASSRVSTTSKASSGRPPRSTVISLQQQQLLKSHLDSILDIALLESPYGMMVSVDRSGVVFVFQ
ncbi:ARM repeat-containing protein [Hyaloscypha bicolor E]|uniref:non-specific serine/threonine protein kinase n=1 Tax=Hyaloscypha bicolor E TaxID=1095630 RepID=A0A2J6THL5_9HELO|nr:ARM repeat-containing protein [Hyaloscypha bicolor E]PMD62525.1 ARM repeat-containing protein [Hyaloscypha bicolor E]